MHFTLGQLVLLVISAASAFLGVTVYQRAPDRVWNRLFLVHASAVSAWVLLNYLIQAAGSVVEAGLYIRLCHPVVAVVVCTCVDLFWVFPEEVGFAPWPRRAVLYGVGLGAALCGLAPNLLVSVRLANGTVLVEYGWPFGVFGVFTVLFLGYADAVLIGKLPRLTGIERAQVKYVFTGMVIGQVFACMTMVVLPVLFHNTYYARWGSAGYSFVIAFMAYAIAKHRIIRPVVALLHAAAYTLTGVILLTFAGLAIVGLRPVLVTTTAPPVLAYLLAGALVGLTAPVVYGGVRHLLERQLPSRRASEGVSRASDAILRTLDMDELPAFLCGVIEGILRPTYVAVYWRERKSHSFRKRAGPARTQGEHGVELPESIAVDETLPTVAMAEHGLVERSQVRRFYTMERARPILAAMRALEAELVAPVLWEGGLAALVLVGEKLSGDMYAPEELNGLQAILPQVSLAVRNAQLYDEVVQVKEYSENILREMKSGVVAVNAERRIMVVNPAAEAILGLRADVVEGRDVAVLPAEIARALLQALAGVPSRGEDRFTVQHANGAKVPVGCTCSVWRGTAQALEGAVAVLNDLTLAEELARERQEAEHLALIRVLSAGMAHEIRNPLVAIRTFSELLPERWDEADFRVRFQRIAKQEIDRIERLLTDLLMLSKPADAVVEPMDVVEVCRGAMGALSALAESAGVELIGNLDAVRAQPLGDESRLHQALVNLIKNAIEHEPVGGRVEVATSRIGASDGLGRILITVYNPSSVVPEEQLPLIFKPFYSKREGGTGLGLVICQTIIEEHHGSISCTSRPGQGTEFAVELPLEAATREYAYGRATGL